MQARQLTPRDRILDAAMLVFRRHGFRRSSIEQAAEAAGLTRQALYHHSTSKEALFRAVVERVYRAGARRRERGGRSGRRRRAQASPISWWREIGARLDLLCSRRSRLAPCRRAVFRTSWAEPRPLSEICFALCRAGHGHDRARLPQTKARIPCGCPQENSWRCVEMAVNGTKSAYPKLQPLDAFLKDLETMLRTLIAGAVGRRRRAKVKAPIAKKSSRQKPGDRK